VQEDEVGDGGQSGGRVRRRGQKGENRQYVAISTKFSYFGGFGASPPLPIWAKFGDKQYTHLLRSHAKFHPNPFIVSPSTNEKLQFGAIIQIWEAAIPSSLH